MSHALSEVAWEGSLVVPGRDPALEAYARRRIGMAHPTVRYFVNAPWVARAMVDLLVEFGLLLELDQRTADLISHVVSQENSCRPVIEKILTHLGLDPQPPPRGRAREAGQD